MLLGHNIKQGYHVSLKKVFKGYNKGQNTYYNVCWFDFLFLGMSTSHWLLKLDWSPDFSVNTKIEKNETAVGEEFGEKSFEHKIVVYNIMFICA